MIQRLSIFAFRSTAILAFTCMAALAQDVPNHACTLLGGSDSTESIQAVVVASNGDLIVAGKTKSADFPITAGAFDEVSNGGVDAFVARISSDATELLAATYIGGSLNDEAVFVHEAAGGSIWVGGTTSSANFPTSVDAFATHSGREDAFVVNLDANLSSLLYGTCFGSPGRDPGQAFAIDEQNELIYLAGFSALRTSPLPVTPNAFQGESSGGVALYLAVLDLSPVGSTLLDYGTYIGGASGESGVGDLTLEGNGIVTLSGRTRSTDFPVTAAAIQSSGGGSNQSAVVVRIDTEADAADALLYGTYISGNLTESKVRHDTDSSGIVHLMLQSNSTDLPLTANALIASSGTNDDIYYAQIDAAQNGSAGLLYASWILTVGSDLAADIVHADGKVAMFMHTTNWGQVATADAFMTSSIGSGHGYFIELDVSSAPDPFVSYASHYAGCDKPGSQLRPSAMAYDGSEIILGGGASFAPVTLNAFQAEANSNISGFVGRLELSPWPTFSSFGSGCAGTAGTPQLVADSLARLCLTLDLEISGNLPSGVGAILLGFDPTQYLGIPLPASLAGIGAAGCEMLVPPKRVFAAAVDAAGIASISISVPDNPSVIGLEIYAQWALLDPAANPLGVVVSNGIKTELRW